MPCFVLRGLALVKRSMVAEPGSRLNRAPAVIPNIFLNLLVWIDCAREVMSAPLIDTRLLGKPPRFEGDINAWKQWRFQTLAYFGALDPDLHEDLKLVTFLLPQS